MSNTTESNESRVRRDAFPVSAKGVRYCALCASLPERFTDSERAAILAEVVAANAKLLDSPVPEGAAVGDLRAKAFSLVPTADFHPYLIPYFPRAVPVVRVDGPCGDFLTDLNGTPLNAAVFATYDGDIRVLRVNLAEYCDFYELGSVTKLAGATVGTLDIEWTTTTGLTDPAEDEIRDSGLIREAVSAKKVGDIRRFELLAAKYAGGVTMSEGRTLDESLADAGLAR